jgi:hypothetical protein
VPQRAIERILTSLRNNLSSFIFTRGVVPSARFSKGCERTDGINLLLFRFLATTTISKLKTLWLFFSSLAVIASSNAQSSRDHWDSMFHPRAVQVRNEQRYDDWLNSWKNRECAPDDVKQFWRMTLIQVLPDSMNAMYYPILHQNQKLEEALQSTLYDFEAQDIADEINIMRLRREGKLPDATALEQLRLERNRIHEQQKFQAEVRTRLEAIGQGLIALRNEVANLRAVTAQAAAAAQTAANNQ